MVEQALAAGSKMRHPRQAEAASRVKSSLTVSCVYGLFTPECPLALHPLPSAVSGAHTAARPADARQQRSLGRAAPDPLQRASRTLNIPGELTNLYSRDHCQLHAGAKLPLGTMASQIAHETRIDAGHTNG